MERVHFGPPWQVAQLNPGTTSPTVPNSVRPAMAPGSLAGTGALLDRTTRWIQTAMLSWRGSRPLLCAGKKLVTPGGVGTPRPFLAVDRFARVTHAPLGVPGGPATGPLVPVVYSKTVVVSAPIPSTPPIT